MDIRQLEGLYDTGPKVMRLQGGWHDGERVQVPDGDWPMVWRMLDRPPDITVTYPTESYPGPTAFPGHPTYEYTDSVNDLGERLYRYVGNR